MSYEYVVKNEQQSEPNDQEQEPPIKVESIKMTQTGQLWIKFTRKILKDVFYQPQTD